MSTPQTRKKEKDVKTWQYASHTARRLPLELSGMSPPPSAPKED